MASDSSSIDFHDDVAMTPGRGFILLLILLLSGLLVWAVLSVAPDNPRLFADVDANLSESGVKNRVTAVLLNFRGYDTLLEVAVLFLAIVGIWSMSRHARVWIKIPDDDPVLVIFARQMLPLMVMAAAYIFWLGADKPGGAFQGGAILGGMGVLWMAAAIWLPDKWKPIRLQPWLRLLLSAGILAFTAVALATLFAGANLLEYPVASAKTLIVIIESAAVLSIGATLTLLFIGGFPRQDSRKIQRKS